MTLGRRLLTGCALLLLPAAAAAQGFEAVGIRALGMGGAFVAVADDASATYWNPAGLVTGPVFSIVAEGGRGDYEGALADTPGDPPGTRAYRRDGGTLMALGTWPLGATFYRLSTTSARVLTAGPVPPPAGTAADVSRLTTTHLGVNVLQTIVSGLHVGATLKYVHGAAGQDAVAPAPEDPFDRSGDIATRGHHRFDMDAGVIADLPRLKVGLTVRNLLEPEFETPVDGMRLQLPRHVRAGIAVRATSTLLLSIDSDLTRTPDPAGERRSLAAGAEQRFWQDRAAIRGGVRVSTAGEARPVVTTGGSVSLRSGLFADGYLAVGLDEAATDAFGIGIRLTF